ncbi:tetratricopeptide repeat protein [Candidatus Methylomirabilis limnetica]|nr:tetratricopeptide repeat-containing serine protease family protein [Candidatus Methylomirabilis limnetica]
MNLAGSILHTAFSLLLIVKLRQYAVLRAVAALGTAALVVSTPAIAKTPSQVFEEVSASVVVVEVYDAKGTQIGQGSGVIIAPGEVATNCHVTKDAQRLQVRHGQVRHPAQVRLSDADRDLCQITAAGLTARPVAIGATKALKVGSRVYAVGAPKGLELTLSEGIVSGLREVSGGRFIQTTAPISPGSSGGGLFDENAALVGLTTFYVSEGQNLNFALPVEWLRELHARHTAQTPAKDSTVGWLAKALALDSRKDWEGLRAHARQWVNAQPKNAVAWYTLGWAYGKLGQSAKAVDAHQQAIRLNPEYADAWNNLGRAYGKLGQPAKAVDAYQQAVRLNPEYADAWSNLGYAYGKLGQSAKAVDAYQQAIRLTPEDADAWHNMGVAYGDLGQWAKAVDAHQQALRLNPEHANAWSNLGYAYGKLGQSAKAVDALQQALRLNPENANAWYNLGVAYDEMGRRDQVMEVYRKLKGLDAAKAEEFFQEVVLP